MQRYSRYLPKKPRKYRQTMHDGLRESGSAMMMPVAVVGALSPRASSFHRLSAIRAAFSSGGPRESSKYNQYSSGSRGPPDEKSTRIAVSG